MKRWKAMLIAVLVEIFAVISANIIYGSEGATLTIGLLGLILSTIGLVLTRFPSIQTSEWNPPFSESVLSQEGFQPIGSFEPQGFEPPQEGFQPIGSFEPQGFEPPQEGFQPIGSFEP